MSITVVAVPFALAQIVTTFITAGASIAAMNALNTNVNKNATDETIHQDSCDDTVVISEANFIEKTFDTPFTDKSILLKTLDEHGFINIHEEYGKIYAKYQNYYLQFERNQETEPYRVSINCLEKDSAEEKLDDLNTEYSMNVQEESYLSIIEKLKENNMEIESEEVLDDNSIVLTVNLEN